MKVEISTQLAPKAIGPYSQAIESNGLIFLSGQIPLVPETGNLGGNSIEEQTRQVLENIKGILSSQGLEMSHVMKCTVFLTDLGHFASFNEIYQSYFSAPYPARTTIQVSKLPKDALIEIEAVAVRG
ncbi:RidA family protein [Oscillatoria laete-virens NRMC-F 0139]|nr:RidA family protein [Oscillatoria laete-virens]MDL5055077.1 RidA family protein [Oscillatoria laete-virens NRMC-F 0139]